MVPLKQARDHLKTMFDDALELAGVIAAYDHIDDSIVFNPDHEAWEDMVRFLHERQRYYSSQHPQHLVRHELGHAMHYRAILSSGQVRDAIWYVENLDSEQMPLAQRVSGRAMWNPKEFVAEVYAGLWAKVVYDDDVMAFFNDFGGVLP